MLKALNLVKIYPKLQSSDSYKPNDRSLALPQNAAVSEIEEKNLAKKGTMAVKGISVSVH